MAIMRASGGLRPCAIGRSWVADLQLAPSTHMMLGRHTLRLCKSATQSDRYSSHPDSWFGATQLE
jgi:hypothetical protein